MSKYWYIVSLQVVHLLIDKSVWTSYELYAGEQATSQRFSGVLKAAIADLIYSKDLLYSLYHLLHVLVCSYGKIFIHCFHNNEYIF